MQAYRYRVTIQTDHRLSLELPAEIPVGEVEVIVLSAEAEAATAAESPVQKVVQVRGALAQGPVPAGDPVRTALDEVRAEPP